jgi:hypothetical protein
MLFNLEADDLSAYATAASAVIAALAICIAAYQIRVSIFEARRATAYQIYKDYLSIAMENPKFSSASYPIDRPRLYEFSQNELEYEKYEYFVSNLLFAAEGILEVAADPAWRATLQDQLKYHALYLQSGDLPEAHFSKAVLKLSDAAIDAYKEEQNLS